jgi:N6-adenosine-specific RNA methylase IME4
VDENLARAELSPLEQRQHLARRKELYEKLHPETLPTKRGGPGWRKKMSRSHGEIDPVPAFVDDAANKIGKGRATVARYIAQAAKIANANAFVGTCLDQDNELPALAKLPAEAQHELAKRIEAGERPSARTELKRLKREEREKALADKTKAAAQELGRRLYSVLYADPPWRFEPYSRETGMDRAADNHYATMSTDEICALPIPAADDSALFLWATVPMLAQAFKVMEAWGFTYKSAMIWVKDRAGTGYWLRNEAEILLIGTKGNVPAPAMGEQPAQVVHEPARRHSEKPDVFAETIEQLFPNLSKMELFARKQRPGWNVWGNEAPEVGDLLMVPLVAP